MPKSKQSQQVPSIKQKPYVIHFRTSTLYKTKAELVSILDQWKAKYAPRGQFTTGLGVARWEKRKK